MRKSRSIRLSLVGAMSVAALAAGCGDPNPSHVQTCVDKNQVVSFDERCQEEERSSHASGYIPMYHWYYSPYRSGYNPVIGSRISEPGGTFVKPSTPTVTARSGVVRGGFGGISAGHSVAS